MFLTKSIDMMYKALVIAIMSLTLISIMPIQNSNAQTSPAGQDKVTEILCRANNFIAGGPGKAIAVLVILSLAIGLFLGKVSWGMAIAVAVGMGILFGAPGIVATISGEAFACDFT
jgi:type IV secretion system protein VirB2